MSLNVGDSSLSLSGLSYPRYNSHNAGDWDKAGLDKTKTFKLINVISDNWGALSTYMPNRTTNWINQPWERAGDKGHVAMQRLKSMMEDQRVELFITQQHHNLTGLIGSKVLIKPLGVPAGGRNHLFSVMMVSA